LGYLTLSIKNGKEFASLDAPDTQVMGDLSS
jgi:hypothetical protein